MATQSQATSLLRLGTRGSLLARMQSQQIAAAVEAANPGVKVELVVLKTTGDRVQDRPLADLGGKGLFTKELEQALLDGDVDFAVHSYKDVPVTMPLVDVYDLVIAAVPKREDPRDVLIGRGGAVSVVSLPLSATVGTGSSRRKCQLLDARPDLNVVGLRGNVDTRLRKVAAGAFDAIVLAYAGLHRAGLLDLTRMIALPLDQCVPSPGQGALAVQCRRADIATIDRLAPLHHAETARCVDIEREVVLALNGDCHSPIAAHAVLHGDEITLHVAVGATDGALPVRRRVISGPLATANGLARRAITELA